MRGEHISFCVVFVAAVYREIITIGVDYTDFEEKDCEKKGKMYVFPHYITGGPPQREKKYCVRNKNETVFKF